MSIYEKLQNARVILQSKPLKKTGKNTFAKYDYFELEDFLPTVQTIFNDVGLCGIMSFTDETATLTIHDTKPKDGVAINRIDVHAPMSSADLKGCHAIQNTGAVISYMRRYLWMLALEIVEHDALDATTGKKHDQKSQLADHKANLEAATSIPELVNAWQIIPKSLHTQLASVKDAMKTKLTPKEAA
jgi:hypothetical protein